MDTKKRQRRQVSIEDRQQRGKRIKYLRKILRYSSRAFGAKCHTKDSTLKSWEQGRHTGLTTDGALSIVEACKKEDVSYCTLEWLLYGKGPDPEIKTGTFSGTASNTIAQELGFFQQLHANAIDIIVQDDSMQPYFFQGDHVAGIRYFAQDINKLVGLNCIVQLQTGEILVRKLNKGKMPDCYTLTCSNTAAKQAIIENVPLFSAAYIIWTRKPNLVF
jgi:hypothetical protein